MWIDGGDGGHVFFGGEDEFVVDDVVGQVAEAVERAGRMQLHGHAGAEVDVLADAFHFGRLGVVARADAFADDVPVGAAARHDHLLHFHDVVQLLSDFLGSA